MDTPFSQFIFISHITPLYLSGKLVFVSFTQKIIFWSFCALFVLVPLIFLPATSELFEFNKMIVTYLLTVVIVSTWVARMLLAKQIIFKRSLLDIPILIFIFFQFISLLFSIDPRTSWLGYYGRFNGGFISLLCYSLLYWAFVSNMTRKSTLFVITSSLITAAIISIWGIMEHFGASVSCIFTTGHFDVNCWVQDVQNRVFASLGQPNWLAAYLIPLIFVPLSLGYQSSKHRPVYYLLSGVFFLTLIFTNSRSGMLAFGISSLIFWGLYLKNTKNWKLFILINSLFIFLVLIFPNVTRELIFKTASKPITPVSQLTGSSTLDTGGTESGAIRKIVWTGAVRAWLSSPKTILIGTGPETFTMAYYQNRPVEHNQTSEWELLYNKAHNEFLNYLTTTGLIGLTGYLLLLGAILVQLLKKLRSKGIENRQLQLALLAGWLSIPITNFWGFSVVIVQLLLFLLPAIATALESVSVKVETAKNTTSISILATLFIACLPALLLTYSIFNYWLADTHYATAAKFEHQFSITQDTQDILTAYQASLQAVDISPNEPVFNSQLGMLTSYIALLTFQSDATASARFVQAAQSANLKAITTSPRHPNYYKTFSRSLILLSALDPEYLSEADRILSLAQKISPTDPRLPYNRGVIAKYLKDYPSATSLFQASLNLKSNFPDAQIQFQEVSTLSAVLK